MVYGIRGLGFRGLVFHKDMVSAVCVDVPVGTPDRQDLIRFNEELVRNSAGMLLPPEPSLSWTFASLWGSHTNMALRVCAQ